MTIAVISRVDCSERALCRPTGTQIAFVRPHAQRRSESAEQDTLTSAAFLQRVKMLKAVAIRVGIGHPPILVGVICLMRSEEHTSELQSLMRISYAVFCL